jgi:DEAD/DEAH box helicase domain-containing protein
MGVKDDNKNHFSDDPAEVYEYYFSHHKNLYFINTPEHLPVDEYEASTTLDCFMDRVNLSLHDTPAPSRMRILAVRKVNDARTRHICPECNSENTINIIGTRVATLSSITVSQVLASDLDPRPEKYRKILAFTNSVQDAAHQAGFIEARNYRFTFRASLQKVLNELNCPIKLDELQQTFIDYWKSRSDETGGQDERAYYYRFLPKDYKGKVDLSRDYRIGATYTDRFKAEFDERIRWEVLSEFGFDAAIGRTLEKTGASGVKFDESLLLQVHPLMRACLDANNLAVIGEQELLHFMQGILHRMRVRGGVDHEYLSKFRGKELSLWDLNWMKDGTHFLNQRFGKKSRLPRMITTEPHTRDLLDTTCTNKKNWFHVYFIRNFPMATNYQAVVNDFYRQLFSTLEQVGVVNKRGGVGIENYALAPSSMIVENQVKYHRCSACGAMLNVALSDVFTEGVKCLSYTCNQGEYALVTNVRPNYYQLVYNRNKSPRIYAAEHTGLLERKDRERKEFDFKERPLFNSLNTIVATSTLEMGINIGTLNTAINNSVPPLPSNYLQRVGRAGRESGSALLVNFAQKKPHDLFYYGEPRDMMEGEVSTPGCFLEAKDILFRHFFAFCLDTWSTSDPEKNSIPATMLSLKLLTSDIFASEFFMQRVITFIRSRKQELLHRFCAFYLPDLSDKGVVLDELRNYLDTDTFYQRLIRVFQLLKEEYRNLLDKQQDIDKEIQERNLGVTDEERKELEAEKRSLRGLKRLIDRRSVIEHLTNVGLLPNYAFPETGVTLDAWVKGYQPLESQSPPEDLQFELVRSSKVALRELAPGNHFYSQGFRFEISGLNTFDWKEPGVLMDKRFCSNCDYLLDDVQTESKTCPKCGDPSWGSVKNHHLFVRMSGVKSVSKSDRATLDDRSDDRESSHYKISRHIKFDPNSTNGAYGMPDIPFGIEYVKKVDITEVNLGLATSVDANKIDIYNQDNVPFHGFVTCRGCGKSTSDPHRAKFDKNFKFHFGYCKNKDRVYEGKRDDVFEEVYLFREVSTEALRILLPIQEFESEAQLNMFKAGLDLGLRKFYKGNPQHIEIIDYSEFNKLTAKFDRFLVLYDLVPGGTGYLEKLFSPENFKEVIQRAYEAIRDCSCKERGKDGCYRCIYSYANQSIQRELSRERAEQLFKRVYEQFGNWEHIPEGLGSLTRTGQIEESELEERFIRGLKNYLNKDLDSGNRFESFKESGVLQYRCYIRNGDYLFVYHIHPQYDLGTAAGVEIHTRADFFIRLISVEKSGVKSNDDTLLDQVKGIAVYLDGYTYHATKDNLRFFDDLAKRMSIVASGNKRTWTLTWDDMNRFESFQADEKQDVFAFDRRRYEKTRMKFETIPYWGKYSGDLLYTLNSMERLIWFLKHPLAEHHAASKTSLLLAIRQEEFGKPTMDISDWEKYKDPFTTLPADLKATQTASGEFYVFPDCGLSDADFARMRVVVHVKDLSMVASLAKRSVMANLDKRQWEQFWQLFNLVQEMVEEVVSKDQ